ncbi:MAG: hypothetical protein ACOX1N_00005 [Candidatus Methanomethylophilaceae archaeon]|jgi:hypothetical protein
MTTCESKVNIGKKLLVPAIALLLCSFAFVGAGYAALTSSTLSNNNSVGTDIIVLTFVDGSGNNIASGAFSSGYSYEVGVNSVMNGTNTTFEYTYGAFSNEKIGESTLKIDATESTVNKVKITYEFTTNLTGGGLPTGMSVEVKMGSSTVHATNGHTQIITPEDVNTFDMEVLLSSTAQTSSTKPLPFTYTLKIIAEPITTQP